MKTFSKLFEQNELINKFSNENSAVKKYILDNNQSDDAKSLKELLELTKSSLEANGKITLKGFQNDDEKLKFFEDNSLSFDPILEKAGFFNKTPVEMGMKSLKQLIMKAVDIVIEQVVTEMLEEIE